MSDSVPFFFYLIAALRHTGGDYSAASLILRVWLHFQGRKSHYEKWLREKPGLGCNVQWCRGTWWIFLMPFGCVEICNVLSGKIVYRRRNTRPISLPLARWNCVFISSVRSCGESQRYVKWNHRNIIHLVSAHLPSRTHLSTHLSTHSFHPLASVICCPVIISQPSKASLSLLSQSSFLLLAITHSISGSLA